MKNSLLTYMRDPVSLAQDFECAKRIELLLQYASIAELRTLVEALAHKFVHLSEHHSGSHVIQSMVVCVARALLVASADDADDVAALNRFVANGVTAMLNVFEESAANRYAPHVFATLIRLLAGAPLLLERVELQRPGTVPGAAEASVWHATSKENIAIIRSVVDWFCALDDAAFGRVVNRSIQSSVVLNALLDVTSDEFVRANWGNKLWLLIVNKASAVDAGTLFPLVTSGGGSLLFERIFQTCPDQKSFEAIFEKSIKNKLVEYAGHAHANHLVSAVLRVSNDRTFVRKIIRSLLPHVGTLLQSVVRRPVGGGNNKKKASYAPVSERQPMPLVIDAMCGAAQHHAIVPLQDQLVAALTQFSIDAAKQSRYERALHRYFTQNANVRVDTAFRASYVDPGPLVSSDGIGGLFRGLLEFNQRQFNLKHALDATHAKKSYFSHSGAQILQSMLAFVSPHCDAVVQSMNAAPADLLLLLARDQCSYVYDRVFTSATVSPQLKQELIDRLLGNVVGMATHNIASRVVEAAFAAADMDRKRAIAQALASEFETIRATKSGAYVLRNCRVTKTGDVSVDWERKQAKVEHTRRMFADITGEKVTTKETKNDAGNANNDDDDDDDEELFGQPKKQDDDEEEMEEEQEEDDNDDNDDDEQPKKKKKVVSAAKQKKKEKKAKKELETKGKDLVDDDELAQQMADFDDYEPMMMNVAATTTSQPKAFDMSILSKIKPVFGTAKTEVVVDEDVSKTTTTTTTTTTTGKRKSAPNARSRRRLKRQLADASKPK
jgi:hypothetical protein